MKHSVLLFAPALLAACATVRAAPASDGLAWARLGQTVRVDSPRVTPLRVLEDSRCPMEARCVWAGQVRLLALVRTGRTSEFRELTNNSPIRVADGSLELVAVTPPQSTQHPPGPREYRFGFRFSSGL